MERAAPHACVRLAREDDAADLLAIDRATVADGRGVVQVLDELGTVEDERAAIGAMLRARLEHRPRAIWVAESGGRVVSYATLRQPGPSLCAHVGIVALATHPESQRRGFGRSVMSALLADADAHGLHRLELYVRHDNTRAHALYESLGFVHEGTRRAFVRTSDGQFIDDRIYCRLRA